MPKFEAKITPLPRKVSPSVRVFSRLDSPMGFEGPKLGQKEGATTVPNVLTLSAAALRPRLRAPPGDPGRPGPAKPHLSENCILGVSPEPAHVLSRTRSPTSPNLITQPSRKTSPPLPQSFTF